MFWGPKFQNQDWLLQVARRESLALYQLLVTSRNNLYSLITPYSASIFPFPSLCLILLSLIGSLAGFMVQPSLEWALLNVLTIITVKADYKQGHILRPRVLIFFERCNLICYAHYVWTPWDTTLGYKSSIFPCSPSPFSFLLLSSQPLLSPSLSCPPLPHSLPFHFLPFNSLPLLSLFPFSSPLFPYFPHFFFSRWVLLCNTDWPGTHWLVQAGPGWPQTWRNPTASAFHKIFGHQGIIFICSYTFLSLFSYSYSLKLLQPPILNLSQHQIN